MITLEDDQVTGLINMLFDAVQTIVTHLVIKGHFGPDVVAWVLEDLDRSVHENVQSDLAKRALYARVEQMTHYLRGQELHEIHTWFVEDEWPGMWERTYDEDGCTTGLR